MKENEGECGEKRRGVEKRVASWNGIKETRGREEEIERGTKKESESERLYERTGLGML